MNIECPDIAPLPNDLKCSDATNRIEKVIMDFDGNCFDKLGNLLGKGFFLNGILHIEREYRMPEGFELVKTNTI